MGTLQCSWQPSVQVRFWGLQKEPLTQFPQVLLQSVPNSPELHSINIEYETCRFYLSLFKKKKPNYFYQYSDKLNI